MKRKILAISGSVRKNSSNERILKKLAQQYVDELNIQLFEELDQLPHFHPDLTVEHVPEKVKAFRDLIEQADGVLICTPEYVFSMPAVLKNAIEWMVSTTIFSHKPTAMIVASASGSKAFESLDLVLSTIEAQMTADTKMLIRGVKGKVDREGTLTDKENRLQLTKLMKALKKMMIEGKS